VDMRQDQIIQLLTLVVLMCFFEGVGIWVAIVIQNYLLLSTFTFVWVWVITECYINKIFLKKLDNYLLETPKATTLIFWIIYIILMILSLNYFVGVILSTILAFMIGDFRKNKGKNN